MPQKLTIGGKTINETENTDYVISFMDGKNCYVNVKFVKKYVDFDYKVVKAEGKSPARIVLKYTSGEKNQMTVKSNIEMRTKAPEPYCNYFEEKYQGYSIGRKWRLDKGWN